MIDDDPLDLSAWFLGPKGENQEFLHRLVSTVLNDYVHWRRNYFPSDRSLATRSVQRRQEEQYEEFETKLDELMAELRRNFPFYSPRYVGHQLSDTTLPALIGLFAGTLFNPNNVTPEAAPVTVDWEIQACSRVLEMLGFAPPPPPPKNATENEDYPTRLRAEFGWAHISSGGTLANIEALWIARAVRYFPLAVRDIATEHGLEVFVKRPSGPESVDIRSLSEYETLILKPNEAIFLLGKFVDAIRRHESLPAPEASSRASELLSESRASAAHGFAGIPSKHVPKIFVSGAAHYSCTKAADVLGIGRANVVLVRTDAMFRMDVEDLKRKLLAEIGKESIPLAVVATLGTTEEGAVDPVHDILELRDNLEREHGASFWLHVDGAWGGYCRTLVCSDADDRIATIQRRLGPAFEFPGDLDLETWQSRFADELLRRFSERSAESEEDPEFDIEPRIDHLSRLLREAPEKYVSGLSKFLLDPSVQPLWDMPAHFRNHSSENASSDADAERERLFEFDLRAHKETIRRFVTDTIRIEHKSYRKDVTVSYGEHQVCASLLALPRAESVTVDPHKLGYAPYPCGVIAFRNDRVRHFVLERAPYITSARHDFLLHLPPQHMREGGEPGDPGSVSTDAFAPFTLEGSRPGSAAVALHLSTSVIPLRMRAHGKIIRSSLLAARELYEWLGHWDKVARAVGADVDYELIRYQNRPPDTNIVIFAVKKRTARSLQSLNRLTDLVYERFTIQAELGEHEYSYSQPFFLSRTTFDQKHYGYGSLKPIFDAHDIRNSRQEYNKHGLRVLRAAVMNPYITPIRQAERQYLIREFMLELARAAETAVVSV